MNEPTCQAGEYVVERTGEFAHARLTSRVADCSICRGTGLARVSVTENGRSYDVTTPCAKAKLERRTRLFDAARVPAVHAASTFATFAPSTAEQNEALTLAKNFALGWPKDRGIVLSGPVGTGKTHLLSGILRHLTLEAGIACQYVEISLLFATIRRGFQDGKSGGEIIGPLSNVEVLAIDELGKGRGSQFELETLDELIARRYNAGKVTLFATNYSLRPPEEKNARGMVDTAALVDAGKESKLLCERVGDRIYSRLCEMCDFVEFNAKTRDERRHRQALASPRRRA